MIRLRAGAATDVGRVRANNQDQLLVAAPLFAVADGMGGHAAGEVASQTALDALRAAFGADPVGGATGPTNGDASGSSGDGTEPAGSTAVALRDAVRVANRAVWDASEARSELRGMGTTLTAVALVHGAAGVELAVVNVGDSRTYRLHNGEFEQLTADHSLVAELVAEGRIRSEEAETHPQRHVLTRALGVYPDVDVDLLTFKPGVGDRYLLCSDGLSREVTDAQVASVLRRLADPGEAARELVAQARDHGGSDNITVVVVDVVGVDDLVADGAAPVGAPAQADDGPPTSVIPALIGPAAEKQRAAETVPAQAGGDGRQTGLPAAERQPAAETVPAHTGDAASQAGLPASQTSDPSSRGPAGEVVPIPSRRARRQQQRAAKAAGPDRGARRQARRAAKAAKGPKARLVTMRVVGFFVLVLAIIGVAFAATAWYARDSYFVQLNGRTITIFKGRPGGVLWWHPTVADPTRVGAGAVEAHNLPALRAGVVEASLGAARQYVHNLQAEKAAATPTTTLPPAPTTTVAHHQTTTTVAPTTTVHHRTTTTIAHHRTTTTTRPHHRTTKKAAKS